ncbi:MAG: hypothetical protein AB2814_06945 [Candidatus Sedimenticola endophacoides]
MSTFNPEGHHIQQVLLQVIAPLGMVADAALEIEQIGMQAPADLLARPRLPLVILEVAEQGLRGGEDLGRAPGVLCHGVALTIDLDQPLGLEQQPLLALGVEQLIVHHHLAPPLVPIEVDIVARELVFAQIPVQGAADLAAVGGLAHLLGLQAPIDTEAAAIRIVADMAGLDNQHILAVMGMRAVAVGGHHAAHQTMVERKGPEVLGDHDHRITLAFVGAERPRRNDLAGLEAQGDRQVVQPGHEPAVAHRHLRHELLSNLVFKP